MANSYQREIPATVETVGDFLHAKDILVGLAHAFMHGGCNFKQACDEAHQEAIYNLSNEEDYYG